MTNIVVTIRDGVATAKLTGILTNGTVYTVTNNLTGVTNSKSYTQEEHQILLDELEYLEKYGYLTLKEME